MEYIAKEKAEFYSGDGYSGMDYISLDKDINLGVIKITSRSPKSGYQVNTGCKELLYITNGSGTLFLKNDESELQFKQGDVIVIDKNEYYAFDGNFEAACSCTPAWTSDQHEYID